MGLRSARRGRLAALEADYAACTLAFGRLLGRFAGVRQFLGGKLSSLRAGHRFGRSKGLGGLGQTNHHTPAAQIATGYENRCAV
jgi:hypothetical protein